MKLFKDCQVARKSDIKKFIYLNNRNDQRAVIILYFLFFTLSFFNAHKIKIADQSIFITH